jgi:hypothetical protein
MMGWFTVSQLADVLIAAPSFRCAPPTAVFALPTVSSALPSAFNLSLPVATDGLLDLAFQLIGAFALILVPHDMPSPSSGFGCSPESTCAHLWRPSTPVLRTRLDHQLILTLFTPPVVWRSVRPSRGPPSSPPPQRDHIVLHVHVQAAARNLAWPSSWLRIFV